jgi:hypothetical protein
MGRINISRVILGGIVGGIVVNILGYLLDGLLLADQWNAGMKALGRAPTARVDRADWSNHHSTPFAIASRPFFTALTNSS